MEREVSLDDAIYRSSDEVEAGCVGEVQDDDDVEKVEFDTRELTRVHGADELRSLRRGE